jgi:transcriptional regulator with PAS, ATPase and Fis domain
MFDSNLLESTPYVWLDQAFQHRNLDYRPDLGNDVCGGCSADRNHNPEDNTHDAVNIKEHRLGPMIGKSRCLQKVFEKMSKTAPSNASVVIYGESGTGKDLAAQTIHNISPRRHHRFVPVNCGAIPEELIESEFFGYKKGAFTGAAMNKPGYLDRADQGTLFLDEVGELSLGMQVKLLRAIDGGGYTPIGSQDIKKPDIRIIAATNRDLRERVRNGHMREDFYYRINVLPISMPPLRARKDDLPLLIHHFMERFSNGQATPMIPERLMTLLKNHHWPGNIRELQNTIHRYVTLKEIGFLKSPRQKDETTTPVARSEFRLDQDLKSAVEEFEKQYISYCLKAVSGHRGKACDLLKINRKTLYKKIERYRLKDLFKK